MMPPTDAPIVARSLQLIEQFNSRARAARS
jgi:hypothetical protein